MRGEEPGRQPRPDRLKQILGWVPWQKGLVTGRTPVTLDEHLVTPSARCSMQEAVYQG